MKTKLLALALLASGSMFAQTRFTFSVGLGGYNRGYYAAPAPYYAVRPPSPGPDYFWSGGYWVRQPHAFYDREEYRDHDFRRDRHDRDDHENDRRFRDR